MKIDWMTTIQTAITTLLYAHPNNASMFYYCAAFYVFILFSYVEFYGCFVAFTEQRQEWSVDFRNNRLSVIHLEENENDSMFLPSFIPFLTHS
jgi:hypothetical protein